MAIRGVSLTTNAYPKLLRVAWSQHRVRSPRIKNHTEGGVPIGRKVDEDLVRFIAGKKRELGDYRLVRGIGRRSRERRSPNPPRALQRKTKARAEARLLVASCPLIRRPVLRSPASGKDRLQRRNSKSATRYQSSVLVSVSPRGDEA